MWLILLEPTIQVGYHALYGSSGNSTNSNVAVGDTALSNISSGGYSVAIGHQALEGLTSGNYSVGVGFRAGQYNIGSNNVLIGFSGWGVSGQSTAGGITVVGRESFYSVTTGGSNIGLGYRAGYPSPQVLTMLLLV